MIINKLRKYKIGGYAIFDLVLSYLFMYLIAKYFNFNVKSTLLLTLPISIIIHKIFNIHTLLTDRFFNKNNYYLLKISILYSVYLAFYS